MTSTFLWISVISPLTTPVMLTHQIPHEMHIAFKFILLERRLSSFIAAQQIFVSQTVLQLHLNTVGLFLGQLRKFQGEIRRQM